MVVLVVAQSLTTYNIQYNLGNEISYSLHFSCERISDFQICVCVCVCVYMYMFAYIVHAWCPVLFFSFHLLYSVLIFEFGT